MIPATSIFIGQRVVHIWQEAQSQIASDSRTDLSSSWTARITSLGVRSMCSATGQPLLHSLEQGGIDWPSSCRNGTCRTCIGRLVSGTVRYEIEWPGLLAEEKEEGYVLPCVAQPCSDVVLREGY